MAIILFVGQSTKHFSYYETSINELEKRGHSVVFRYDPVFSRSIIHPALKNFLKSTNAQLKWMHKPSFIIRYFSNFIRELRTYSWYLRRTDQSSYYIDRWPDLFPGFIANILKMRGVRWFVKQKFLFSALNIIERLLPASRRIIHDIESVAPDLVYVSPANMRYSGEIDYIKAADKLGIRTAVTVYSWDNLTNKGLFHWKPDTFLVWNLHHKQELMGLHDIEAERIEIVGAQLFDKWHKADEQVKPSKKLLGFLVEPYILYLGSSSNIANDETPLLYEISKQILALGDDCKIIFKPHPAYYEYYDKLDIERVLILPEEFGLSETTQDVINFRCLVNEAKCVLGINTSGFLDSIIIGKRTFAYLSPDHEQTQRLSAHYKLLSEYRVIEEVRSYEELIGNFADDSDFHRNREKFIKSFVWPHGDSVDAGFHAANIIEQKLS